MKKIIALMMVMLMLLSGCAALDDAPGASISLADLTFFAGDTMLDLTGFRAVLDVADDDNGTAGLRLRFETDEASYGQAILAVDEEQIVLDMNGSVYTLGMDVVADTLGELLGEVAGDSGMFDDELWAALEQADLENMTEEELEEFLAQLEEQMADMGYDEEPYFYGGINTNIPEEALEQIAELVSDCTTPGGEYEINGVIYQVSQLHVDNETMMQVIELLDDTGTARQTMEESGVTMEIVGELYDGEVDAMVDMRVNVGGPDGSVITVGLSLILSTIDGNISVSAWATQDSTQIMAFGLNMAVEADNDPDWLYVDTAGATAITDLESEEVLEQLSEDAEAFANSLMEGVFEVMMTNMAAYAG